MFDAEKSLLVSYTPTFAKEPIFATNLCINVFLIMIKCYNIYKIVIYDIERTKNTIHPVKYIKEELL